MFCVGTSDNENINLTMNLTPSYPNWFHLSIRVCGSNNLATGCLRYWDGTSD